MNFNSYFTIKHTSNLRILLLTLFFIVPLGTIYGQNQLITIAGKNITLLKAFDAIESQTQLSITYSRTKIDVNRTLSVDFKKQKLSIVLDKLLAGTGFTYKIEKGYIVLVPVPVKQEQTEATSKKIQGVIVDTNGDPVIGASIQEKGVAGKGTVSDLDGKFNLSVASNAVLLISYIGFQSLEVKVGNRTSLSLVLKEDHQLLDEVVVIGYGTMEKRAVTSSITSISSKDLVTGLGGLLAVKLLIGVRKGGAVAGEALVGVFQQFPVLFRKTAAGFLVNRLHAGEKLRIERNVVRQLGELGLNAQRDLLHLVRGRGFEQVVENTRNAVEQRPLTLQRHDGVAEGRLLGVIDDRLDLGARAGDGRIERRLVIRKLDLRERRRLVGRVPLRQQGKYRRDQLYF